jgi:hypothetical protein
MIGLFKRFLGMCKDYPKDEASWEFENELIVTHLDSVIEDNDFI